jgi:hypothetical protein
MIMIMRTCGMAIDADQSAERAPRDHPAHRAGDGVHSQFHGLGLRALSDRRGSGACMRPGFMHMPKPIGEN